MRSFGGEGQKVGFDGRNKMKEGVRRKKKSGKNEYERDEEVILDWES